MTDLGLIYKYSQFSPHHQIPQNSHRFLLNSYVLLKNDINFVFLQSKTVSVYGRKTKYKSWRFTYYR